MNAFKTKLLVGLFVPALALASGVASAVGDTKVTGQPATNGSTNTNDKSTAAPSATTNGSTNTNDKSTAAPSNTTGMSSSSTAFARLDTNHDRKLSAAEAAADPKVQGMWKKLDANNDGTVSQAEFSAQLK